MATTYEFVNFNDPNINTGDSAFNRGVIATHIGRQREDNKVRSTKRRRNTVSIPKQHSWSAFRVVLQKQRSDPTHDRTSTHDSIKHKRKDDDTEATRRHQPVKSQWTFDLPKQLARNNAGVFDPFSNTTLAQLPGSYKLIDFYRSYTQRSPVVDQLVSVALEDKAYLLPLLLYVSVVMARLQISDDEELDIQYYAANSYSALRKQLNGDVRGQAACLQAMVLLAAAALWQGQRDITRIHLTGVIAMLNRIIRQPNPPLISQGIIEAIIFLDHWSAMSCLKRPLFPQVPDKLYKPVPEDTPDSEKLRPISSEVVTQCYGKFSYLVTDFVTCTHAWISNWSRPEAGPQIRKVVFYTHKIILQALTLVSNDTVTDADSLNVIFMVLLGCIFQILPTCGSGTWGSGFNLFLNEGVFPIFTSSALLKYKDTHEELYWALRLWNENAETVSDTLPEIQDLNWFIYKMCLPVKMLAGDKYSAFPTLLKAYLTQQSQYSMNQAATSDDESYFKLRERLFGSVNSRYPLIPIL